MNLLDLMVKIGVDDQVTGKLGGMASAIGNGLGTAAKAGAAAITATSAAAVGMATAVTSAASQVAQYGDNIDKMSQKMGMSAAAYQEWDAVMQHSGTSMETMKASMKTLANAAESGNEAFERLGMTQEEIASMNQEQLFEATIAGLQNVEDTTERTYLAGQLLGRGATELGALLNTSAEDTQAMRDRVHELGGVMEDDAVKAAARFQDSLQDMETALGGLKRNMVSDFLPGMATVMDGLGDIFSGDTEGGAAVVSEGVGQIVAVLQDAAPRIAEVVTALAPTVIEAAVEIITAVAKELPSMVAELVPVIIGLAPTLFEAGLQMFVGIVEALAQSGPEIIAAMLDVAGQLAELLVQYAPQILEATGLMLLGILQGIAQAIAPAMEGMNGVVEGMLQAIGNFFSDMFTKGGELIGNVADGVAQGVSDMATAAGDAVQGAIDAVGGFFKDMWDAGANLIAGLAQGIASAPGKVIEAVTGAVDGAISEAKKLLGIASPSKVFRGIGENTMLGLEEGILGGSKGVRRAMDGIMGSLSATPSLALAGAGMGGAHVDNRTYYVGDVSYLPDSAIAAGIEGLVDELQAELRMG